MHILTTEPDWENDPIEMICGAVSAKLNTRDVCWFGGCQHQKSGTHNLTAHNAQTKKRTRVTDEERAEIIRLAKTGMMYAEIARRVGVSQTTCQSIACSAGINRGQGVKKYAGTCAREGCDALITVVNKSGYCRKHAPRKRG